MFKKEYKIIDDGIYFYLVWKYAHFPLSLLGWFYPDEYDSEMFDTKEEAVLAIKRLV